MNLWKMFNGKIYVEDDLAMFINIFNVHAPNVVTAFILQKNYIIYLSAQVYKDRSAKMINATYL